MLPKVDRILFAAGLGHDTSYVLDYAFSLAQKYDARIYVVHSHEALNITDQELVEIYMEQEGVEDAFEASLLDTEEKVANYLQKICCRELEKLSAAPEVIAEIRVSRYAPKAAILAAAKEFEADLIVMGSHRQTAMADALLGSTTLKVLHSAEIPVLVVRIPRQLLED